MGLKDTQSPDLHGQLEAEGARFSGPVQVISEDLLIELVEAVVQRELEPIQATLEKLLNRSSAKVTESDTLLTAGELADLLKCDRRTVRRLELSGEMPAGLRIGGSKRWRAADVRRWLGGLAERASGVRKP